MTGIWVGSALGCGMLLILQWFMDRMPTLAQRVAPHIRPLEGWGSGRAVAARPRSALDQWVPTTVRNAGRAALPGFPGSDVSVRLRRAGSPLTVEQFQAQQLVWAASGLCVGLVLALGLAARGSSPVALVVMIAGCGAAGGAARTAVLSRAVARRDTQVLAELPTIADMLALAVSAGEGALGALERVVRTASGVLVDELRFALGEVRTGTPLSDAFHSLAERSGVPALSRLAGGIAIAIERGTPLADLLHSQALDVREAGRRRLIEDGGKREIAMMIPVVFLILPVTVIFAVFPGIIAIRLGT